MQNLSWIALAALVSVFLGERGVAQFAYGPVPVAEAGQGLFCGYQTDQGGNFTPLTGSPFAPKNAGLNSLVADPVTNFLYAYYSPFGTKQPQQLIQPYRINAAGSPVPVGKPLTYRPPPLVHKGDFDYGSIGAISGTGSYILIVNTETDDEGFGADTRLSFLRIEKSGSVIYTPKDVYAFGSDVQVIATHPSGKFFFGEDNNTVFGYRVESNWTLTSIPGPTLANPWSIGFDLTGQYFYEFFTPTAAPPLELAVFTVGSDGALTQIPGSPFQDTTGGFDVTNPMYFHPNGKYVYALGYPVTTGQAAFICAYSIANNGQLVPLPGSPYALPGVETIAPELTMTMDPGGNFIVISDLGYDPSGINWVYLIQPDGTLQPGANSPSSAIPIIDCVAP
jgi:hypothetical protein